MVFAGLIRTRPRGECFMIVWAIFTCHELPHQLAAPTAGKSATAMEISILLRAEVAYASITIHVMAIGTEHEIFEHVFLTAPVAVGTLAKRSSYQFALWATRACREAFR